MPFPQLCQLVVVSEVVLLTGRLLAHSGAAENCNHHPCTFILLLSYRYLVSCLRDKKKHFLNPFLKLSSIEQSAVKYADYRKKLLFLSIVHRLIPIEGHCSSIKVLAQCVAQVGLDHWKINTNMFSGFELSLWIIWSPGPFLSF